MNTSLTADRLVVQSTGWYETKVSLMVTVVGVRRLHASIWIRRWPLTV